MTNQLDSKTGLIKSINAKDSDGMRLGLGTGKLVVQPLLFGVLPKSRALPFSLLRTKICPACDPFQRLWQPLLAVGCFWKGRQLLLK